MSALACDLVNWAFAPLASLGLPLGLPSQDDAVAVLGHLEAQHTFVLGPNTCELLAHFGTAPCYVPMGPEVQGTAA